MRHFLSLFARAKQFYATHERRIAFVALVSGFVIDNLTLRRIDLLAENLLLVGYLLIAGAAILVMNIYDAGGMRHRIGGWARLISPVAIQFAFGGLFSAFFVFYFRSASIGASWPFILFLLVMMIGNEIFVKKFERMAFQVGVFFIAVLSFSIFLVPVILGRLGFIIFLSSLALSVTLIGFFVYALFRINKEVFLDSRRWIFLSLGGILLVVTLSYVFNIIPPIPLSVKEKVVAYEVNRLPGGNYQVFAENLAWYEKFRLYQTAYIANGSPLYVFSSVFAPTRLSADIVHEWQIKTADGWQTQSSVRFPVTGGRDAGYRGYSVKYFLEPGDWRVNIETEKGATIGRLRFKVVAVDILPEVEERTY